MIFDVELMRALLFDLESRQTSPRSTIILSIEAEAHAIGRPAVDVQTSLAGLLDLDYIDGPGSDAPGVFLFRKLTRKGAQFVRTTRHPGEWDRMKRHFARKRFVDDKA